MAKKAKSKGDMARAKKNKAAGAVAITLLPATLAIIASFCEPTLLVALVSKQFLERAEENREVMTTCRDIEGPLSLLRWAQDSGCPPQMLARVAAYGGHLQLLRKLFPPTCHMCASSVGAAAARGGHVHILEWIGRRGWDGVCAAAAAEGNWDIVEWALDHDVEPDASVIMAAARAGKVNLISRALSKSTCRLLMTEAYSVCIRRRDLDTFRALTRHDAAVAILRSRQTRTAICLNSFVKMAIAAGRLDAIKWAMANAVATPDLIPSNSSDISWEFVLAAENRGTDVSALTFSDIDDRMNFFMSYVDETLDIGFVEFSINNSIHIPQAVAYNAAKEGRTDVLMWLHETGEKMLRLAIDTNKINIIKWLHARKCPGWDGNLPAMANAYTRDAVRKWLVRNNSRGRRTAKAVRRGKGVTE
ncbi:hypothetical protein JKP88DRAFT_296247 [Tribonema minus]|uniref:Ankyrin repeat protein n=1 Tax=Tribonema minus TaxID=303371 RepID=A0A835ZCQ3_9STRA|nr:hypothetical protein JKP88DRAFT_296247 [Tribonema minus]